MKILLTNERRLRQIGIPVVSLLFMAIYHDGNIYNLSTLFLSFIISFTFTLALWEGNRTIVMLLRRQYPRSQQTARRLVEQMVLCILFTLLATIIINWFYTSLGISVCESGEFLVFMVSNLVPMVIVVSVYEGAYFFDNWVENLKHSEALAQENIRSQFEALKNQLDPHFLFNSMNTLAALIEEDNEPAQKYLEELSDVYRYVLVSKQKETVPLQEELTFVESYIYLNKTRYRDNLIVDNRIPETALQQSVPPLSLQILVENAIKHNVISKEKPLVLRLSQDAHGYITVENNIQKKNVLEKSTKTGLQNMINRYALLTDREVEILQSADFFSVKIPPLSS